MKIFLNKNKIIFLSILIISFFQIFLNSFTGKITFVPETHFLASNLDFFLKNNGDITYSIYELIRTPAYFLLQYIYQDLVFYFFFTYIFEVVLSVIIFLILLKITNHVNSTILVFLFISPLFQTVFFKFFGFSIFPPISSSFDNGFSDWGTFTFSARSIITLIFLSQIYAYLKNRYFITIFLTILSFLIHPNSGILIALLILFSEFLLIIRHSGSSKFFIFLSITVSLFLLQNFLKLDSIFASEGFESSRNIIWYENMIKNEADDFSIIFNISENPIKFIIYLIFFCFLLLMANKNLPKNEYFSKLLFMSFLPFMGYILFFLLELSLIFFNKNPLVVPLISLQPGHKLLNLSAFPISILLIYIIEKRIDYFFSKRILDFSLILLFFISASSLFFIKDGLEKQFKHISYLQDNNRYEDSIISKFDIKYGGLNPLLGDNEFYEISNDDIKTYKNIFFYPKIMDFDKQQEIKSKDLEFHKKYDKSYIFKDFLKIIRKNIPEESKIIIPIYYSFLRDTLSKYTIFFQEHHDGNLMLGSNKIFEPLISRMRSFKNLDYSLMPSQKSGYQHTFMRNIYLSIDKNDIENIKNKYPDYSFFISEASHNLPYEIIFKDNFFIIYKIN